MFLGQPLCFYEAPEPTNIIWQHRHTTTTTIIKNSTIALIVILVLLTGALILFKMMMAVTITNQLRYPPSQDCTGYDSMFNDDTTIGHEYYLYASFDKPFTVGK